MFESSSRQQVVPLHLCREVMESAPHSFPTVPARPSSIVWSAGEFKCALGGHSSGEENSTSQSEERKDNMDGSSELQDGGRAERGRQ
jgi:hypothetical protein